MSTKSDLYKGDAKSRIYVETNEDFAIVCILDLSEVKVIINDGFVEIEFFGDMSEYGYMSVRVDELSYFTMDLEDINFQVPDNTISANIIKSLFK